MWLSGYVELVDCGLGKEVGCRCVIVLGEFGELCVFDIGRDHYTSSGVDHWGAEDIFRESFKLRANVFEDVCVEALAELEFFELLRTNRAVGNTDVR